MTDLTERRLGWGFGLLGAVLIVVGGVVSAVVAMANAITGHPGDAAFLGTSALVLVVVGVLAAFFAYLGYRPWSDRPLVSGILLVALAAVGWAALGLGANVLALIGALFVFLAGLLFIVGPALSGTHHVTSTA